MRGAVVLGVVSGVILGLAAEGYVAAYPDETDRLAVAEGIGASPGLAALFGQPRALETIAGFTEWRILGVVPFIAAVWAILAASAALRGEEDAGRWDVLLSAPITRRQATGWGLVGLGQSLAALAVAGVAAGLVVGTRTLGVAGVLWMSAVLLMTAGVFGATAALSCQLAGTRAAALRLAAAVLGVSYLLRVVGIATETEWLAWLTPLGWGDLAAPLTGPDPLPLALGAVVAGGLAGSAAYLAGLRDAGAGLLQPRRAPRSRPGLLSGSLGLTGRLARPAAIGWLLGLAVLGVVLGVVAPSAGEALADASLEDSFVDLGGPGVEGPTAFLGAAFLVVSLLLGLLAAGQASAAREQEAHGRLETLLALPLPRWRWFAAQAAVAAGMILAGGLVAGASAWAGTVASGEQLEFADAIAAGANVVPGALVVLGLGLLAFGTVPRATAVVAYGYVAAAFILEVFGSVLDLPAALLGLSVFHHVPLVPAVDAQPATTAALLAVALTTGALGALGFARRDLTFA